MRSNSFSNREFKRREKHRAKEASKAAKAAAQPQQQTTTQDAATPSTNVEDLNPNVWRAYIYAHQVLS